MAFSFVGQCWFYSFMLGTRKVCAPFTDEQIQAAKDF